MSFVVVILLEDWEVFEPPGTGGIFEFLPSPGWGPGEPPYDQDHVGGEPTTGDHSWDGGQTNDSRYQCS